jgi:hypothetical protein
MFGVIPEHGITKRGFDSIVQLLENGNFVIDFVVRPW